MSREEYKDIVKFLKQFQENSKGEPDPEIPSDEEQLKAWSQFTNAINTIENPAPALRSTPSTDPALAPQPSPSIQQTPLSALNGVQGESNEENNIIENLPKEATVADLPLLTPLSALQNPAPQTKIEATTTTQAIPKRYHKPPLSEIRFRSELPKGPVPQHYQRSFNPIEYVLDNNGYIVERLQQLPHLK